MDSSASVLRFEAGAPPMKRPARSAALILLVFCMLVPASVKAQVGSFDVGLQSPTAASLGKFGDVPVSLYTGTPAIDIPLYGVQGRTLSVPIALQYHASGIKVGDIASWVRPGSSIHGRWSASESEPAAGPRPPCRRRSPGRTPPGTGTSALVFPMGKARALLFWAKHFLRQC